MPGLELSNLVAHFAQGLVAADARRPVAVNRRSGTSFRPGIGPHSEDQTVELIVRELEVAWPQLYAERWTRGVPYPSQPRKKCDLCLGSRRNWEWAVEVKMVRFLGDNGKANDNILMHLLSPYPSHNSALTDCEKLLTSSLPGKRAILVYGFDNEEWPLGPAIEAFETLARARLGPRQVAPFDGLVHPVHRRGRVFGRELRPSWG